MTNSIAPFKAVTFTAPNGEKITATKNNGVVTLVSDKGSIRQIPLEDFMKELPTMNLKLERTPASDTVTFKGNEKNIEKNQEPKEESKKEASTAKKFGVGLASFLLPGLGQAINGEWGKGLGFLGGCLLYPIVMTPICFPLALAGTIGIGLFATVDAVKNAKA